MLVGDVIINARALAPDLPAALGAPTIGAITAVAATPFLPAATYQVKITQLNQWGESIPSLEVASIQDGAHKMSVAFSNIAPATTKLRFYIGTGGANSENQYIETTSLASPFIIDGTILGTAKSGIIPARSTAYLPDMDGARVSAFRIYTWLNQALLQAAKVAGGIKDVLGIPSVINQGTYDLPLSTIPNTANLINQWSKFTDGWYDGYVIEPQNQRLVFRRNPIASLAWQFNYIQQSNRLIIEIFPQAQRTAGSANAINTILPTDTSIVLDSVASFVLPIGLALITPNDAFARHNVSTCELIAYSGISGNTLTGVIRGLGGTTPTEYDSDVPVGGSGNFVNECNIRLQGLRLTGQGYTPGNATNVLLVPDGWDGPLSTFILAQYKLAEQDVEGYKNLMLEFKAGMEMFKSSKYPSASQIPADSDRQVYGSGLGGGWLIP